MRKISNKQGFGYAVLLLIGLIVFYYVIEVIIARVNTQEIVDSYYRTGQVKMTTDDLSPRQLEILLRIEDPNFYRHHGIDFKTPGAGWTTITQSLAKKFYFKDFKQGIMKVKQTLCARFALDSLVAKETQINLYLNLMYYGNDVYGLKDAAEYYYHKEFQDIDEDEYIALIASLTSPSTLNVKDYPTENAQRVQRIKKMLSGLYQPRGVFDITYEGADEVQ